MTSLCIMQIWRNLVTWTVLLQGPQCKYVLDFIVLSLIFSWFLHALIHKLESEIFTLYHSDPHVFGIHKHKQNTREIRTQVYCLFLPLRMLRAWCLSRDHPPRFEGTSSNPCIRAVLLSHWIMPGHDSYS